MKYKIDSKLVTKAMEHLNSKAGHRPVTLNSLRTSGLTRTETDNLFNEDYDFSLKAICILADQLLCDPLVLVENQSLVFTDLPMAVEASVFHDLRDRHLQPGGHGKEHYISSSSKKSYSLLRSISSDQFRSQYLGAEEFDQEWVDQILSKRQLDEKRGYADHVSFLGNQSIWINNIDPEIVIKNKDELEKFQKQLEQFIDLNDQKANRHTSLSELLQKAESSLDSRNINFRMIGDDYQIFYIPLIRDNVISEEAIGDASDFEDDFPLYYRYSHQRIYNFKYVPSAVDHIFIIAPRDTEYLVLEWFSHYKEKHVFDISREQDALWAETFWNTDWNEAGGIGPIEDEFPF